MRDVILDLRGKLTVIKAKSAFHANHAGRFQPIASFSVEARAARYWNMPLDKRKPFSHTLSTESTVTCAILKLTCQDSAKVRGVIHPR